MSILPIARDRVSLKSLVPYLPSAIQQRLREAHYLSKLRAAALTDEEDLGVIAALVNDGDCVLDIGANFGLFTRFLSEATGDEGQVFAFEPTDAMSQVLKHNVTSLGLTNVKTSTLALSDKPGKAAMSVPLHGNQTPNYYEASLCEIADAPIGEVDTVETTTVDLFCESEALEQLAFIKCDVEGHEIAVLNGARITLEKFRPSILLEVNEPLDEAGHGQAVRDLIGFLGYSIHVFEDGKIRPRVAGERFVNYVLLPAELV